MLNYTRHCLKSPVIQISRLLRGYPLSAQFNTIGIVLNWVKLPKNNLIKGKRQKLIAR